MNMSDESNRSGRRKHAIATVIFLLSLCLGIFSCVGDQPGLGAGLIAAGGIAALIVLLR